MQVVANSEYFYDYDILGFFFLYFYFEQHI